MRLKSTPVECFQHGRRAIQFGGANGSPTGDGHDKSGGFFVQKGTMDNLPSNVRRNLECELVWEPRLKVVKLEHDGIWGIRVDWTNGYKDIFALIRTILQIIQGGHGARSLGQVLYDIVILCRSSIRIENSFSNRTLGQTQYRIQRWPPYGERSWWYSDIS